MAVVHVAAPASLDPRDGALLAELGRRCCAPGTVGGWCDRLNAASALLANAGRPSPPPPPPLRLDRLFPTRPTTPLPPTEFCSWPEVLCSRNGSLLKLSMPGPGSLSCGGSPGSPTAAAAGAAVAALANATRLAWLDLSATGLGFRLEAAAPLLAAPSLLIVELAAAGLTGPLAFGEDDDDSGAAGGSAAAGCDWLSPPSRAVLVLSGNALTGRVPDCLAAHPGLQELQLGGNAGLQGLPRDWSRASSLRLLDVSSARSLAGPLAALPPGLRHLNMSLAALGGGLPRLPPSLMSLDMLAAGLSGPMAGGGEGEGGGWSGCTNLTYVDLGSNDLRGSLPALPSSLLVLYLDSNRLRGGLPDELPPGLLVLNVSANGLSGQLPRGGAPGARYMDVSRNSFTGPLPASLAAAAQLIYLNASDNALTGGLGSFAARLRTGANSLQVLDLSHNSLSGTLPPSLSQLAVFSVQSALPSFPRVLDMS
ncbi:hypothetical protein GPECTOR_28g799 [Gonium pectorale]|uniref:Leucine-rich repeat-containing N-terminal plant-type domain-containing protein n=1 Tax=Gonium pectorale TaxID=33097 RepID=A0A150GEX8_GONPE|nr:hypothetical protein GPECTOR_28g799 [Gonium pectorale]|eukprot:KXZ48392.1 hypothetical protein GPECTOR_28g799 [Gonium pectorale]